MIKEKVITSFVRYSDANLDVIAGSAVKNLTGNANFTFANGELTTLTVAATNYHSKLAALFTGGTTAVIEKNAARTDVLNTLNIVAIYVNLQANGDLIKLQSSGLPLQLHKEYHVQPVPANLNVLTGNGSNLVVSVATSAAGDSGTVFAYTPVTSAVTDPNLWSLIPVNGHSATIKGLTKGVEYKVTAAYKGTDDDELVWAPPITKTASN